MMKDEYTAIQRQLKSKLKPESDHKNPRFRSGNYNDGYEDAIKVAMSIVHQYKPK